MKFLIVGLIALFGTTAVLASDLGKSVTWDRQSLMIDGRRVCPVMGEVHYSRIPADEWKAEVKKIK
ncbi:MAG: beta-galactosidase, partial [Prevotella sp.]|nr:beta-galactosidase [Prevotella sp.]